MTRIILVAVALSAALSPVAGAAKGKSAKARAAAAAPAAATTAGAAPAATAAPVAAAAAPGKPASFEELRAQAGAAGDLGSLVEPLFAACAAVDDLGKRQCELIRKWHLERLKTRTWYATADKVSLQDQPYDRAAKSLTLVVNGCLECSHPPVVAGAPRLLATAAPKGMDEGVPVGLDLDSRDLPFESADKAKFWLDKVRPRLRVEFVFGVGQPFESKLAKGVAIRLLGHRVFNQCTGEVLASEPPSTDKIKIVNRDPSCPAADAPSDEAIALAKAEALLPDTISRQEVIRVMSPIQQRFY